VKEARKEAGEGGGGGDGHVVSTITSTPSKGTLVQGRKEEIIGIEGIEGRH
jgi:hypothetical protein